MLNQLLLNLALLMAGVLLLARLERPGSRQPRLLLLSLLGASGLGLLLMYNAVPVAPGLLLDLRSVVVALAAQRYGVLAGLAVALPLAAYHWLLGGARVGPALLNLVLVAVLAGSNTGWRRHVPWSPDDDLRRQWWVPLRVFAVANLAVFPGFALAQRPLPGALLTYGALTLFSSAGLVVAHSIQQGRLRAAQRTSQLEDLAYVDSLTGCANRRRFEEDFAHARQPAYLLMLDLDHFKQVNDSYGHEVGDQVLVIVGATLRGAVRTSDDVYRLGGEEFAVVLGECHEDAAFAVAEHILHCVQLQVATRAQLPGESVTISGGLTPLSGDRAEVLRAADEQLYRAKAAGRNCVAAMTRVVRGLHPARTTTRTSVPHH